MRYACAAITALFALTVFAPTTEFGKSPSGVLSIAGYQLVSEQPATLTESFATYSATLTNSGAPAPNIWAKVISLSSGATVLPHQDVLRFSPVPANGQFASNNTFTLLVNRTVPFSFSNLQWVFQGPYANAGFDQTVPVGTRAILNGTASTDAGGLPLTYSWFVKSAPGGSSASVTNANGPLASFVPDIAGDYILNLTVTDGAASDTASVKVSTIGSAPVANAGPNQTVAPGSAVTLDGTGSYDPAGKPITYFWSLVSIPNGSKASLLSMNASPMPQFQVDLAGTYILQLVVNNGSLSSAPSTVTITTGNTPPVANAGPSQYVPVDGLVQLDGSASTDVNGDPLAYKWTLVSSPEGSTAALSNSSAVNPIFTADVPGVYVAELVVNDTKNDSVPSTVVISTGTVLEPTANAGSDQTISLGSVTLHGSGSDPQSLPLTFYWSLITVPTSSLARLSSPNAQNPTFTADLPGMYVAQLTVTNSAGVASMPATVTLSTSPLPPVADPGQSQNVLEGATVILDGSHSTSNSQGPLAYLWAILTRPAGSAASLSGADTASPLLITDAAGVYVMQLVVNDGTNRSSPKTVAITAGSTQISLNPTALDLSTNANSTLNVNLNAAAPPGGVVVNLSGFDKNVISAPPSVWIAGGSKSAAVTITPVGAGSTTILASGGGNQPASATVNVTSVSIMLTLSSSAVGITHSITGTITLSAPAPPSGTVVTLSSSPDGLVTLNSSTVTIAKGNLTGSFSVTGVAAGNAVITASSVGYVNGTANLLVAGLGAIGLGPNVALAPGSAAALAVKLTTPAPSGGITLTLTSSDPSKVTVPNSVFIAEKAFAPVTQPQVTAVTFGSASITGSAPGYTVVGTSVTVGAHLSFTASFVAIGVGATQSLTLSLSAPAPPGNLTVSLSSANAKIATVPSSVTFLAGGMTVSVPVTGVASGTTTITANSTSATVQPGQVTVAVTTFGGIILLPTSSVTVGQSVPFPVKLSTLAPASGVTVTLSSSNGSAVSISPSTVFIPGGQTQPAAQPVIAGVGVGTASILASAPGWISANSTVQAIAALSFSPTSLSLNAGTSQNLTLTLSGAAPTTALVVTLSANPIGNITLPATVTIPANSHSVGFSVTGNKPGTVTVVTATAPSAASGQVTVSVPLAGTIQLPSGITLAPGSSAAFEVTLPVPAPAGGVTVSLSSSNPNIVGVSPASVAIAAGATQPVVQPQVTAVNFGSATISASAPGFTTGSQTVTVAAGMSFVPANVTLAGPVTQNLTLQLSAPAPGTGLVVTLTASPGGVVSVPATLLIASKATSATVPVTAVAAGSATITASTTTPGIGSAKATVTVQNAAAIGVPTNVSTKVGQATAFPIALPIPVQHATVVTLVSSDAGTVTVSPSTVSIPAGATQPAVQPQITGVKAGSATVTASAPLFGSGISAVQVTATVGSITVVSGTAQSAPVNSAFASPLKVLVKNTLGQPASGVVVTFTVVPGTNGAGGSFAGGQNTATTDASGTATSAVFAANGKLGAYTVNATTSGLSTSFTLTNISGTASSIIATGGTPQSATINAAFAAPLSATVKDSGGNPVPAVVVTFAAPSTGAGGSFAGGLKTATTNAQGVATSAIFTANSTAGTYTVTASAPNVTVAADFTLTNLTGSPFAITAMGGTPQTAQTGKQFGSPLVAHVSDAGGNPVNGAVVTFTAPSIGAGAKFPGGVTSTATTDTQGNATSPLLTANSTVGSYKILASVPGVSSGAAFTLTNTVGGPASIIATSGSGQSAIEGTAFAAPLVATVKDGSGNPLSGILVTFTAPPLTGASGTFAGGVASATTGANGSATSPIFTANNVAGTYNVTASVAGVTTPATFTLTNTAPIAGSITATGGTPQGAAVNTQFATALSATVKDSNGKLLSGAIVTFSAPLSGASGTFAGGSKTDITITNAQGVATATAFTADSTAGAYQVTASVKQGTTTLSAVFNLTNTPGVPASVMITGGNSQSAQVGAAFTNPLQVVVKDGEGNLLSGTAVVFTAPSTGAGATFAGNVTTASVTTNSSGLATSPALTANTKTGSYQITAQAGSVSAQFSLQNTPGAVSALTVSNGSSQSAQINKPFAAPLVALAADSHGNPIPGISVTFTAPASGASGTFAGGSHVATAVTNANGLATSSQFTANSVTGSYSVRAATGSLFADFALSNQPGAVASVTVASGSGQSATVTTAFANVLKVLAKDAGGNPVPGATVTFSAPASGASGTFAGGQTTAVTDGTGTATSAVFTANSVAGPYTVAASAGGITANFSLTNLPGPAAAISAAAGSPQSAPIGTAFAIDLAGSRNRCPTQSGERRGGDLCRT